MRILLDECLPRKLKQEFAGQDVATVPEMGWAGLKNGDLLAAAQSLFDVFITIDASLPFQQNTSGMQLALDLLAAPNSRLDSLRPLVPQILAGLETIQPGETLRIVAP